MHNTKGKKNKRGGSLVIILAIVLLIAGGLTILIPVMLHSMELTLGENDYAELREQLSQDRTNDLLNREAGARIVRFNEAVYSGNETASAAETINASESGLTSQSYLAAPTQAGAHFDACQSENSDFIAWIRIPGTSIDYPIVQSDNIDHYLNYTFTGKKSSLGTLFSLTKTDYQTPGANIAIYGHHIRSNESVMFSPLMQYKEQSFYSGHGTIYLDSLYHTDTYKIFAVLNMRYGDWDPSAASFASKRDFQDFVDRAKSQSLYDTGIEVKASDQILTLITCDRSFIPVHGRLVVMAVRQ